MPGRFRHLVVVEGGRLPDPPTSKALERKAADPEVPGLTYVKEFLTETEEEKLVRTIDGCEWLADIKRRVQHYGWRYDYKARKVGRSMYIGPLPDWACDLGKRLIEKGLVPQLPDQVIVNEYIENQGILRHADADSFADGIATISLLESWEMVFREKGTKRKVGQVLERRSVAVMSGDARYRWTHEIPKRKTERGRVMRKRRISLTFRKVIVPSNGALESGGLIAYEAQVGTTAVRESRASLPARTTGGVRPSAGLKPAVRENPQSWQGAEPAEDCGYSASEKPSSRELSVSPRLRSGRAEAGQRSP